MVLQMVWHWFGLGLLALTPVLVLTRFLVLCGLDYNTKQITQRLEGCFLRGP